MVSEVYEALVEAGASPEKARAAASAIPAAKDPAAKEYLMEARDELGRRTGWIERDKILLKFAYGPVIPASRIKTAFLS